MKAEQWNETSIEMGEQGVTHIASGEGKTFWVMGTDLNTFKVVGEDTGGAYALFDSMVIPHGGPPPHIHHREDEAWYVLDGEFEFLDGNRTFTATTGSFVYIPKGTLHRFENVGMEPAEMVVLCIPAGFEGFLREVGQPAKEGATAPPPGLEDIEKALAAGPEYGLETPPPPEREVRNTSEMPERTPETKTKGERP